MRLTDIMSNMDLTVWPEIAMVIFLGVFVLVCIRALTLNRRADVKKLARLALEDEVQEERR